MLFSTFRQQFEPVTIGEADVNKGNIVFSAGNCRASLLTVLGRIQIVPQTAEPVGHRCENLPIIVDK